MLRHKKHKAFLAFYVWITLILVKRDPLFLRLSCFLGTDPYRKHKLSLHEHQSILSSRVLTKPWTDRNGFPHTRRTFLPGNVTNQPGWDEATEVTVSSRLIHIPVNLRQAGESAGVQLGGGSPPPSSGLWRSADRRAENEPDKTAVFQPDNERQFMKQTKVNRTDTVD